MPCVPFWLNIILKLQDIPVGVHFCPDGSEHKASSWPFPKVLQPKQRRSKPSVGRPAGTQICTSSSTPSHVTQSWTKCWLHKILSWRQPKLLQEIIPQNKHSLLCQVPPTADSARNMGSYFHGGSDRTGSDQTGCKHRVVEVTPEEVFTGYYFN